MTLPIFSGSHYHGPILGSDRAMAGALENAPIDAFGQTRWVTYFNDFKLVDHDYNTTTDWSLTQVTGGSASIVVNAATRDIGVLVLDCPAANQGPIVQLDGSGTVTAAPLGHLPAAAVSGTSIATEAVFAARFRIQDVSAQGTFVGLAELNSASAVIATPTGGITSDTHIGFHTDSTGDLIFTVAGNDDTAAQTATSILPDALTDSEWIEVACRASGNTRARGYIREPGSKTKWKEVADIELTTAWDSQLLVTMANLGGAANDDLWVDYVYLSRLRDTTE